MRKVRAILAGIAVAGAIATAAPAAAQTSGGPQESPLQGEQVSAAAWQGTCAKGDFCVWSGKNGTGTKCSWYGDDPDWQGGSVQCRPRFFVASYWNNGYTGSYDRVSVYLHADYESDWHWGTIPVRSSGTNLWEGVPMRSHKWVN